MNSVMTVDFHGNALYGTRVGQVVYVALKPIVEAMGLEWTAQYRRVQRDPVLKEGIAVMAIPSARGGLQDTIGLKLDLIPGWLFKISSLRIKRAEIREKIILFQRECYEVLSRHFLGKPDQSDQSSYRWQSLRLKLAREARLTFGKRAGAEVWFACGLVHTPSMAKPPEQRDLFDQ